jgi:hypothetical protein
MLEPDKDPSPKTMAQLVNAICKQGGRIVEFRSNTCNQQVRYILVGANSDIGYVREALKGKLFYVAIMDYKWVEDCLRFFRRVDPAMYNLENGYIKLEFGGVKKEEAEPEDIIKDSAQNKDKSMVSEAKK